MPRLNQIRSTARSLTRGCVLLSGYFTASSSGVNASSTTQETPGVTVTRNATGVYRLTLIEPYQEVLSADAQLIGATTGQAFLRVELGTVTSVGPTRYVDLHMVAGTLSGFVSVPIKSTATDAASVADRSLAVTAGQTLTCALFRAPHTLLIRAAHFIPELAVTADTTNFKRIQLNKVGTTGAVQGGQTTSNVTTTAGVTGGTGNLTRNAAVALTLNATTSNITMTAGQSLIMRLTSGGSGVAFPKGVVTVVYRDVAALNLGTQEVHYNIVARASRIRRG